MKFILVVKKKKKTVSLPFLFSNHAINMYNTLDVNARIKQLFEINLEFGINGIIIFFERKFLSLDQAKKRRNKITFIFKATSLSVEWKAMRREGEKPFQPEFLVHQRIQCMSLIVRCVAKLLAGVRIIGPATEFLVVEGTLINVYSICIYIIYIYIYKR